jgi:hypothetical protein
MALGRSLTLLAGSAVGYALARRVGLCGPDGGCLTWGMAASIGGVGLLVLEIATLAFDPGDGGPGAG